MHRTRWRWVVILGLIAVSTGAATNQVLMLNGSTDYVVVPDAAELQLTATDFTISAWVRPNAEKYMHILTKREGSLGWHVRLDVRTNATTSVAYAVASGGDPSISTTNVVPVGAWTHIALTYRAADSNAWLYLNGEQVNTATNLRPPAATTRDLHIGRDTSAAQYYFDGLLEDIRIWTRRLTAPEVRGLMKERLTGSEDGLIAYWTFDDGTASDATGRGHNGTLMGTPTGLPDHAVTNGIAQAVEIYFGSGSPVTRYRLQACTNLVEGLWQNTGEPAYGTSAESSLYDSTRGSSLKFYRVTPEY